MSLLGSPWRRFGRFGRPASSVVRRGRARGLTVRRVTRDFTLWEQEFTDADGRAGSGVVTGCARVVDVPLGHRPIEEVAVHLRRLRSALDTMTTDVSFIRFEGVVRAYDDYLFVACRELGVATDLPTIGFGRQRDEERTRLECRLREAGLAVR